MPSIMLPVALTIVGLILLVVSNVMYYMRTRDKQWLQRFWLGKDILSPTEYILNRGGLGLALGGLGVTCVMRLLT